ncbi:putative RNA-directed DNA polymerase from transposon X-element [Trichonephila clavipes]|nr:putative RNA-directed DNA polymerase from transposon X-element [Trichonephila clavipes]
MTSFISWNCRGLRTRLADLKSHHIHVPARMRCSSGDISEEYHDSANRAVDFDHCLCLLNNDEKTYFHAPTRTFHSPRSSHLFANSATDVEFRGCKRSAQQRSFPPYLAHVNGAGTRFRPPTYHFHRADWDKFTRLAIITGTMVQNRAVDEAVFNVTEAIRNAADAAIPKHPIPPRKLCKPWWNASLPTSQKEQRRAWGIFRRYPTTDNLIAFKRAKALARRIRRQCQRNLGSNVAHLIGKTFASVSSSDSYSPAFQATKNRLERTPINFRCRQPLPYNCDFDMLELKRALSSAHNTSPGSDGISYELLRHLNEDSLASLYVDDLQISCEGSDMRMIERQLQTAVNNILKWCDTNGHSISASKSCCVHFCRKRGIHPDPEIRIRDIQIPVVPDVRFLGVIFDRRLTFLPHILHLRKKCEKSLNLLKVLSNTSWGDRTSLLRVYQAIVLSRIDYGCVAYGSACNSTLQKLDPVHHMALRICSGAFRTSPVQSLYVMSSASSRSSTEEAVSCVLF